jgi:hypothetical protein
LEGNFGTNKYLELYNGTAGTINLSDYQLRLYVNGAATPTQTATLAGNLPPGGVIVYGNSAGTIYTGFTALDPICNFNGDDAVALWKISTAAYVDIFGNIGDDPGASWTAGTLSTANQSLVRNPNICAGVTIDPSGTGPSAFTTLGSQWSNAGTDAVADLGLHTMTCGPTVNFSTSTGSALENTGTATVNLAISPATAAAGTISITIGVGSTATYGTDYTTTPAAVGNVITISVPIGATSASFTINIVDDAITEGNETIDFTITGATGGTSIGAVSNHVFTITDDDTTPTINFSTLSITVLENAGSQTFVLSFLPTTHPSGNLTITISGAGTATYGSDYTTAPAGGGGTFVVGFGPNTPTVSFTTTVINDVLPEPTENAIFTITAVSAGFAIGSNNSATLVIGDNDSPPTVLLPGDLAIVGVNANDGGCNGGDPADFDYVSFFCFKEITFGTQLIFTDNGYERCTTGQWGNVEGTVRMTRTGPAIPAGQVITFRIRNTSGTTNVGSVAPDAAWTCANIGIGGTTLALNAGGEQLFFMQGGTWNPGTTGGNNATYTGTVLYAFSTNPSPPWTASCGTNPNQRSNLPPGVECFSMAPTSATDYSKYIGPITAADQRDWIIRIDNTANWNAYPNCTQYNSLGYIWLSAPILPIIPGTMTHGLWRGGTNTDWFECKNWDDARIPDALTDVVINNTALRNCEVGLSPGINPGGTGVCASVLQNYGTAPVFALFVKNNSTLNIGGKLDIRHTAGAGIVYTRVDTNATLTADSVRITGYTTSAIQAMLRAEAPGSMVQVSGNLTIGQGGYLDLSGSLGGSGTLQIGGNFTNTDGEAQFSEPYSLVTFNGNAGQSVNNPGFQERFYNLQMNKPAGQLVLNAPVAVTNQLDFISGQILSTATNLPTVNNNATAVGMSDASFVNGPVQKIGLQPFTFPIGKNNSYRPAGLANIAGIGTDAFTAEYFPSDPTIAVGPLVLPTTLNHVSHCEYWDISRSSGTPNARVVLSWDTPESCGVTPGALGDLRVAHWNGSNWDDRGNGGTTGNATTGTVSTAAVETAFSPWTLASVTANNPLPIELLSFTATPAGHVVDLKWSTASERDNAFFTVERSVDAQHFEGISQLPAVGNSQSVIYYADVDHTPMPGLSYYRLRQTDQDGTSTLSEAVPVLFQGKGGMPLTVLYGQDGLYVLHDFAQGSTLEVLDATGRFVRSAVITEEGLSPVPLGGLSHGMYILRATDGSRVESTQLAY